MAGVEPAHRGTSARRAGEHRPTIRAVGATAAGDRYVEVPGGRLRVRDEGAGPPLLLVHAGIARLESWDAVAAQLVQPVIEWCATTCGPGACRRPTMWSLPPGRRRGGARCHADRPCRPGRQLDGRRALVQHGHRVSARVAAVVGVGAGLAGYEPEVATGGGRAVRRDGAARGGRPTRPGRDRGHRRPRLGRRARSARRPSPAWIRETIRDWDRELNRPDRVTGRQVRLDPPAGARLAELRCPVLAVAGALDFTEVADTARHLAAEAPDARAVIWADVAHMIGMEQPERLAAEIVAFAGSLPPW